MAGAYLVSAAASDLMAEDFGITESGSGACGLHRTEGEADVGRKLVMGGEDGGHGDDKVGVGVGREWNMRSQVEEEMVG